MKKFFAVSMLTAISFALSANSKSMNHEETRATIGVISAPSVIDFDSLINSDIPEVAEFSTKSINPGIRVINQSNRAVCIILTLENPLRSMGWRMLQNGQGA